MPDREPTATEVLIALNAHVSSCALWQKVNTVFIGAVFSAVVVFAGYSYVHGQVLADDLARSRSEVSTAISQLPARTAEVLNAAPGGASSSGSGNR